MEKIVLRIGDKIAAVDLMTNPANVVIRSGMKAVLITGWANIPTGRRNMVDRDMIRDLRNRAGFAAIRKGTVRERHRVTNTHMAKADTVVEAMAVPVGARSPAEVTEIVRNVTQDRKGDTAASLRVNGNGRLVQPASVKAAMPVTVVSQVRGDRSRDRRKADFVERGQKDTRDPTIGSKKMSVNGFRTTITSMRQTLKFRYRTAK